MADFCNVAVDFGSLFSHCTQVDSETGDMPADEDFIEDLPSSSDMSSDHKFYRALLAKACTLPEGEAGFKCVLIEYASELLAGLNLSAATNASRGKALEEAIQDLTRYVSNQRVYLFIKIYCLYCPSPPTCKPYTALQLEAL